MGAYAGPTNFLNVGASPSLMLNFARDKNLKDRISGNNLITFTRSSTGTYVNSVGIITSNAANVPRFDHNPVTGESLGLLIEESRTNLTTYSEQLDNARWAVANFTLSANTTDTTTPDGTNTAEKILETVTNGIHAFASYNAYSISAGTIYTASIFVRSINKQFVQLVFDDTATTNGGHINFDLTAGTITASANYGTGASISGTITSYPNNWYRLSITTTAGTSGTFGRFAVNGIISGSSVAFQGYAGNTSNGYYIWGAQVEQATFPTSYIPTVASTVTRSADNVSMTGINFSSWYNSSEGSVYCRYNRIGIQASNTGVSTPWGVSDGTFSNSISLVGGSLVPTSRRFDILNSGSATAQLFFSETETTQTFNKSCVTYKLNDIAGSYNAQTVLTDTSSNIPAVNVFCIGRRDPASGIDYLNGNISQLFYYPSRLTNTKLQQTTQIFS